MPTSSTDATLSPIDRIAQRALEFVADGMVVGLGSGRAATSFIRALGARVQQGLAVRGLPTSEPTAAVAREVGIPLVSFADVAAVDVTVDGADEVDPQLDLIKGYGKALVREKIVAAASNLEIILVGAEKLVPVLGSRGLVPVEVVPFALEFCTRRFTELGCRPQARREVGGELVVSDNGNLIVDCGVAPLANPHALDERLRSVPGVVGTGLFLGIADRVLIANDDGSIREQVRPRPL